MFGVVVCPQCRHAKVFELGRKQTTCAHCDRVLKLDRLEVQHRAEDAEEARHAAGVLNARYTGAGEDAYAEAVALPTGTEPRASPASSARPGGPSGGARVGETKKADGALRTLAGRDFDAAAFAGALETAGVPPARAAHHLERLVKSGVVFEPRHGVYRVL